MEKQSIYKSLHTKKQQQQQNSYSKEKRKKSLDVNSPFTIFHTAKKRQSLQNNIHFTTTIHTASKNNPFTTVPSQQLLILQREEREKSLCNNSPFTTFHVAKNDSPFKTSFTLQPLFILQRKTAFTTAFHTARK